MDLMFRSSSRSIRTSRASASWTLLFVAYQPGWFRSVHKRLRVPLSFRIAITAAAFDSTATIALLYSFCTLMSLSANLPGSSRPSQNATSLRSSASQTTSAELSPLLPKPAGSAVIRYRVPTRACSSAWMPWLFARGSETATSSNRRRESAGMIGEELPNHPS